MASTMAAAAAHSMPPFPLPAVPRIRPPPIPKGTPGPNTLPQPGRPPVNGLVWADGRWANPRSRSAQHKQEIVSKQLEKALQHEVHGMNIYAYKHMRTHQVVYSLTKNMDNNKILKQLLYHGKKTVPAALRRDVWRPYFSVHFAKTPAGALKGLKVFQELRELSAVRQLSPPEDLTLATQKDFDGIKRGYNAVEWLDKTTNEIPRTKLLVPPVVGERLPKKLLAKRLMNQAATSVADIAAILARQADPIAFKLAHRKRSTKDDETEPLTPQQQMDEITEKRKDREASLSIRNHSRLQEIRKKEEAKADQLEQRQGYLTNRPGMAKVDAHTQKRISIEYDGVGQSLSMIEEADESTMQEIGAARRLQQTLENIENEKRTQRQNIEKTLATTIEEQLMQMTQAERDQIEKDVEAERTQRQSEIDAKVAAIREGYQKQRKKLYRQPATAARTLALRKLSRDSQAAVYALKTDLRSRHLKWVGPFAGIATAVDTAMAEIDDNWKDPLAQLQKEAEDEKQRHANPINHEVEIRWANLRDGTHAKSWPDTVFHTELQSKAVSKSMNRAVTTHFHFDEDEEPIETQIGLVETSRRSTVHVFGSVAPDRTSSTHAKGRYESPSELLAQHQEEKARRINEWRDTEAVLLRDRILALRSESNEVQQQFARTDVDEEATPYIAGCVASIDQARDAVSRIKSDSYRTEDADAILADVAYIDDLLPYCREEMSKSADPIADEARIKYFSIETNLIRLEVQNPEARVQADVRQAFVSLFNKREVKEDAMQRFKDDPKLFEAAERELREFDDENPLIINMLTARKEAIKQLPAEIKDISRSMTRLVRNIRTATDPDDIASLEAQLEAEKQDIRSKRAELKKLEEEEKAGRDVIREAIRNDKQAWLDYKSENGISVYETRPNTYARTPQQGTGEATAQEITEGGEGGARGRPDNRGMVMEAPEIPQSEKKGPMSWAGRSWKGVKGVFGAK